MKRLLIALIFSISICQFAFVPLGLTLPPAPGGDAASIQGRAVETADPTDADCLMWNAGTAQWEATTCPGAGTGAPTDAEYITYSAVVGLSAERVLTESTGIDLSTAVAGQIRINVDLTELVNQTWGAGEASSTHTFNVSGTTDPVWTYSDGVVNLSAGTLQQGGVAVQVQGNDIAAADGNNIFSIDADNEATDTVVIRARDVDGGAWVDMLTATSSNTPTLALAATGAITVISSGSTVTVESVVFTGGAITGITASDGLTIGDGGSSNYMTISDTGGVTFAGTATFAASGATSSIPWVVGTATGSNTTEGTAYWESDTDILTIGDGTTGVSLDFTANTVITFPAATATLAKVDAPVFTTSIEAPFLILGSSATAADAGAVRMANNTNLAWELAATGTDVTLGVNTTDDMVVALVAATDIFKVTTGNFQVGAGTMGQTFDGADAYITGFLEVDGMIYADGGVTGSLTGAASLNILKSALVAAGDLLTASAASTPAVITDVAAGQPLLSGGVGVVPAYAGYTFSGTGAATYTFPGASATLARTDAGQTFTGVNIFTAPTFTTSITPSAAGASTVGTTALEWGNAYFTDSAVIYGQADQSATLTSSASLWTANNFGVTTQFKLPSSDADPTATAGYLRHDSTISNFTGGGLVYYNGAAIKQVVDMTTATASACTEAQVIVYDAAADLWKCADAPAADADIVAIAALTATDGLILIGNISDAWSLSTYKFPLADCAENQILKANGAGDFICAADADTGGTTLINNLGDADGAGTVALAAYQQIWTSSLNSAGANLTLTNTTADLTADVSFIDLKYTDDGDANGFFIRGYDNAAADLKFSIGADGAATFGTVSATTFTGALTGNASTATLASTVTVVDGTDATSFVAIFDSATGSLAVKTDAGLTYAADTGMLTATGFTGPLTGNASTATLAATVTVVDSTDATSFVLIADSATGSLAVKTDAGLTYAADTGILTATGFAGPLTGNVTGNVSGTSGSTTGNAATVTVADAADDTTTWPLLGTGATGSLAPATDSSLTYNASTGILTATGFAGALTGNVTGNASGTAATVTGAAQANITSVGTLTGLTVSGAIIPNAANTIALGSSSAEWADLFLGDGAIIYGQNDSSNTITSSATGWTFALDITVSGGNINTGNIALTVGDATTDSITFSTDGTGNGELTFPADSIGDADIDWGSGAGQVDLDDVPDSTTYQKIVADDVDASGHVNRLYDSDGTGYITVTGLTVARAITFVDAAQTVANLASSQTFAGSNTFTPVQYFGGAAAAGSFRIYDGSDNYVTVAYPASSVNTTFNLPVTAGGAGQALITDGAGNTSWSAAGMGDVISVGDCTTDACLDGTSDGGTWIKFYDAQGSTQLIGGDTAGAVVLTLPITTGTLAGLASAQTFTANNVFGNADTDTLSVQAIMRGVGRAITIDDDATSAPTYATGTNELFVEGDIETDGTIYAAAFQGVAGTDGQRAITMTSNTTFTPAGDQIYFLNDVGYISEGGTGRTIVTSNKSVTWTSTTQSFAGVTNFVLPTSAADAAGEMSIGTTNHQLIFHAGGSSADNAVQNFDFDSCANGQLMKTNGSGVWTCADDVGASAVTLDGVGDPTTDTAIVMDAGEEVLFQYTGAFTTGSQFMVQQITGNASGGVLFEVRTADTDVTNARFGDGTNYFQISAAGNPSFAGTAGFASYVQLNEIAAPATPGANSARIYAEDVPTGGTPAGFTVLSYKDDTAMVRKLVRDSVIVVYNGTVSTIAAGQAVYHTGAVAGTGNFPNVGLADASVVAKMPAICITIESITASQYGRCMQVGLLEGVPTTGLTAGSPIYVSASDDGALTITAPVAPNQMQQVGTSMYANAAGTMQVVMGDLQQRETGTRSNDFSVGDGLVGAKTVTFAAAVDGILTWSPTSAAKTITIPNASGSMVLSPTAGPVSFTGPSTSRAYALPDAAATILTDNAAVTVAQGGTGRATGTTAYALVATGTTATGAQQTLPAGLTTQILVGGGTSALPAWGADIPTAVTIGSAYIYRAAGTDVPVTDGGTGLSAGTEGGIPWYSTTTAMASSALLTANAVMIGGGIDAAPSTLAAATTGQILVGVTGAAPAWGTDLATATTIGGAYITRVGGTDVTVADGGTGLSSGTEGGIPWYTTTTAMASSALLAANAVMVGGGVDAAPNTITSTATAGYILTAQGAGVAPIWATPAAAVAHDILSAGHSDSTASAVSVGSLIYGTGGTPKWTELVKGGEGTILRAGATEIGWSTTTWVDAYPIGSIPYASAANVVSALAAGAAGKVLMGAGAAAPVWSTPTYPSASGTARKILVSDGTNNVYSTELWPVPGAAGLTMYSDGTNWVTLAAGANTTILVGGGAGAPVWTTATGSGAPVRGTSPVFTTSILPSAAGATAIGTTLLPFSSIFIGDAATNNVQLINTAAASAVVLTLPSTTGTLARLEDKIADLAASTSAELAAKISDEQGTGVIVYSDSPTFVDDITIGAAGVKLTGSDGDLTILGLGDGADESVTINLDDTDNSVVVTSTATTINISALNFVTTGTIQGGINVITDADSHTITNAEAYGTLGVATGAGTWILPTAVAGMSFCLMDSGTNHDLILDVQAADDIQLKGTEQANGVGITNAATTTTGDFVCAVAISAGHWVTMGMGGVWASQ